MNSHKKIASFNQYRISDAARVGVLLDTTFLLQYCFVLLNENNSINFTKLNVQKLGYIEIENPHLFPPL